MHLIPGQHIHLIGVGGAGLSAIARVLLQQGFFVSGSDMRSNAYTEALKRDGAVIFEGHDPTQVGEAELVIISSAVPRDNLEVLAAQAQGIPVLKRSDVISTIMSGHTNIAIAGAHGKTTTAAMTAHILMQTGQSPSYIIGGIMKNTGTNAGVGTGKAFVIEADEYDNMFHGLRPNVEVITNIEYDHPDFFRSQREMIVSFTRFVGLLPKDGLLIVCADDSTAMIYSDNRTVVRLPTTSYGIRNPRARWRAENIRVEDSVTVFDVVHEKQPKGTVRLKMVGNHNILNALAALVVADHEQVPFADAAKALATFESTERRFEVRGAADGVIVVDDYAHHPTEIKATLAAARTRFGDRKIWAVWQPHTYSRTQQLLDAYINAFVDSDYVLVTDIYAAREKPSDSINSKQIVAAMRHKNVRHTPSLEDAVSLLVREVHEPAAIIIMSAGDAPKIGAEFLAHRGQS